MDKSSYQKYVRTDCFRICTQDYVKRHSSCEMCSKSARLQAHHLSYANLGHERSDDLLAVCEECHKMFHKLPGGTPVGWIWQRVAYMPDSEKKKLILGWLA